MTAERIALQRKQADFAEVVNVQSETGTITKQLGGLLANDLPWASLLDTLRDSGERSGVTVDGISGSLNDQAAGAGTGANTLPSTSGSATVGVLTITGSAPDKPTVAQYVDTLSTLSTVANPFVTSVAKGSEGDYTFSLTVDVTADALCGRFTTKCKTTGGN